MCRRGALSIYRKTHLGPLFIESGGDSTIFLSEPNGGSIVENRLILSLTNNSNETVSERLYIFLNPYEDWGSALTVSVSDYWKVTELLSDNRKAWIVEPDMAIGCEPNETFYIQFEHIVCKLDRERILCIGLYLESSARIGYIPVFQKYHEVMAKRFVCNRNTAGVLDTVRFEWEVLGSCTAIYFLPASNALGADLLDTSKGARTQTVLESTNYALLMKRGDITAYAESAVTVLDAKIVSFTTNAASVRYGQAVKLEYVLKNTYHAYLNAGIGRVETNGTLRDTDGGDLQKGSITAYPKWKNNQYRLTVLGKDRLYESIVTVAVTDYLGINSLNFRCTYVSSDKQYEYTLQWEIENCTKIALVTSDNKERSNGNKKGSVIFRDTAAQKLQLTATLEGAGGQRQVVSRQCD